MGRKCKCAVSGDIGNTGEFIKIGNKYYKSQEVYDKEQQRKENYRKLIDYICSTFLGYRDGQPFPPALPKLLKKLNYYDSEVIHEAFVQSEKDILYWLTHKQFSSQYSKMAYMFAIIENKVGDVDKQMRRKLTQERESKKRSEASVVFSEARSNIGGKDISQFLDSDDM